MNEDRVEWIRTAEPKRRWFRPPTYTLKKSHKPHLAADREVVHKWHAAKARVAQMIREEGDSLTIILGGKWGVMAECGYIYSFDPWMASTSHGTAEYRDQIKTDKLRCKKCDKAIADRIG